LGENAEDAGVVDDLEPVGHLSGLIDGLAEVLRCWEVPPSSLCWGPGERAERGIVRGREAWFAI
jgi:hypothetical protein